MPALAVWTPEDGLLGALAPLGLAIAAGRPSLVVDLDEQGPSYPGPSSLAGLAADRPRLSDLRPGRTGVAVLRNGGVPASQASDVIEGILDGWDCVVLRLPPRTTVVVPIPIVPVRLDIPGGWFGPVPSPAVRQATGRRPRGTVVGVRLPVPSHSAIGALLRGEMPPRWDRWIRAWGKVWEVPWGR